jgi:nitrogen fixation NifU-like protein
VVKDRGVDMDENSESVFQKMQKYFLGSSSEPFSDKVLDLAYEPTNVGEIEDADAVGFVKGDCGDRMAIFLKMDRGKIKKATFLTDGCGATIACGSAVTELIRNKSSYEAIKIYPQMVIRYLDGLPTSHVHCAVLAVQTVHEALENLKKRNECKNSNKVLFHK